MADIGGNNVSLFVIVLAILFLDIFCIVISTTNPPINTSVGGSSTTPWPQLGAKKQHNNQQKVVPQPNNQNTQLSYSNQFSSNQNLPQRLNSPNYANGAHSGLALSYGPGQAIIVPQAKPQNNNNQIQNLNKNQNLSTNKNLNTNQNLNHKQNLNQNIPQGVWSNSEKTQQVLNNLTPSTTTKPATTSISTPKPTVQNVPSTTTGSLKSTTNNKQTSSSTQNPMSSTENSNSEDEELRQFFEKLIKKDSGTAVQHVTVNYQGKTTSRSMNDEAPQPLLNINPAAYQIPSISKLIALHNNYILETNVNEHVTPQERLEENDLLDSIVNTPVMQTARNFLIQKGVVSKDPKDFRDKLKEIWFTMYSRGGGRIGSSGFEHVFLAEIKNSDVTGLHNWIYFKDAEAKGLANYLGYMRKIDLGNKGSILKHHFTFNGYDKPVGSMFIGTSPELEIALYSTCFLLKPDQVCPMRFDGKNFIVRTYTFRYRGKNMIGSAFPEI